MTRARHCTWPGSYNSPGLQLTHELAPCINSHEGGAMPLSWALSLEDHLGDTHQILLLVHLELVDGFVRGQGEVDDHG